MTTLLFEHAIFAEHEVPSGHVERPERVIAIQERFAEPPFSDLKRGVVEPAALADIIAVHSQDYQAAIEEATPETGLVTLNPDTFLSARSYAAAVSAAGAACGAVDAVLRGSADNAFCAVRPPGHHAMASQSMGFCIFNNAAIAARYAQRRHGADRIAIVDWDVHHGNGTQAIFWDDDSVFYGSTHQSSLFPWTGAESETGVGNIVNAPLPSGAGGDDFQVAFETKILPSIGRFSPDLIVISAGFDAHWRDPLGGLALAGSDFAWATERLMQSADQHCGGRIVSLLEGGYDLEGLVESAAAHVAALMQ